MKTNWILFAAALGGVLLEGCSRVGDQPPTPQTDAVSFTAGIAQTRTADGGDAWTKGDAVGIYMVASGGSITVAADLLAENVQYDITDETTGELSPASGTPIYYPQSGSVDFAAYYPHAPVTAGVYNISAAEQSDPAAVDVLYAKTTGMSKNNPQVALAFAHVLAKVTLDVKAGTGFASDDISALDPSSVVFGGMPTAAALALQDGALTAGADLAQTFNPLKNPTPTAGYAASFMALLIPQAAGVYAGRTVTFTVGGQPYKWTIPDSEPFAAGNHYTYPVTVNKTGITVGVPAITGWTTRDNGTGMAKLLDAIKIPAGTFSMGENGDTETSPVHSVTLSKDFYMSEYQVTNAQYAAFLNAKGIDSNGMGEVTYYKTDFATPVTENQPFISSYSKNVSHNGTDWVAKSGLEDHPVVYVTWYGAKAYADWVGGALPTEAQWEYACRAGTTTTFYFGDDPNDLISYGWSLENSSWNTKAVGQKLPNAYGLYDMHGNVWEWCADWYGTYESDPATDPAGNANGSYRVLRGGSWFVYADYCRSAYRYYYSPEGGLNSFGLRVVFLP